MPGSDNGGTGGSRSSAATFTLKEPLGTSTGASCRDKVELSMSMHEAGKPFGELEEAEEETWLQRWWTFLCGTPGRACLGCCALILIAIIIIVPIVVLVITPIIVNMFVNATTMTVINASLAEPTTDTMVVQAFVELNNAGPLPATLRGFNATMYDNSGRDIGWLVFPDFDLDSNSANLQEVVSLLTITNTEAIYEEGLKMLAGKPVSWTVRGSTSIVALGFGFNVDIEKPLTFPGVYLDNFQTKNVRINHANATMNYIVMDADLEFTSVSTLEFLRIGTLRSDLWYNMDANNATKHGFSKVYREFYGSRLCTPQMKIDGECANGWEVSENIGWCDMFDFKVARGVNRIKAQIFLYNTKTNGYNLGRWVSQWEQTIISVGPINKFFLNRIWQGLVTLEAGPEKMFTGALGTKQTFVQGYNTQTGANCDFYNQGDDVCDKGAIIMAKNPFGREWALKKIEYDVFFEEEYEYDATFNINAVGLPINLVQFSCAATDIFARMKSKPGMWAMAPNHDPITQGGPSSGYAVTGYPDDDPTTGDDERLAARLSDEVIPLPVGGDAATGTYNFFLAATPYPGLAEKVNGPGKTGPCVLGIDGLDPFDCCMTTIFSAAGCKAQQRGHSHINVISRGNATMIVDGMEMIVYPEVKLPLSYTNDVLNFDAVGGTALGNVAQAGFTCSDIRFKGVSEPLYPPRAGSDAR